ncbi:hypothetical protein [Natrinema sp. DC36]|nr:hypothetical protein [Natrinema sp. DC36]
MVLPLGRTINEFGALMVAYTPRITVTEIRVSALASEADAMFRSRSL